MRRPPSYMSDDGVDYVLEAEPRSIAPTTDVPVPTHPAERVPAGCGIENMNNDGRGS